MKKLLFFTLFIFASTMLYAQQDEAPKEKVEESEWGADAPEEVEAPEKVEELKKVEATKDIKASKEAQKPEVSSDEMAFEMATDELKGANQNFTDARKAYKDAENALAVARARHKEARRSMNAAKKKANPVEIKRYNVNVNPFLGEMSAGTNYGYSTFLEGSEGGGLLNISKNAETEFKKFMSQYTASKVRRQKGELFFDNILIPQVSSYNVDMYVDFEKEEGGVNMRAYFNLGDDFLNGTEKSSADKAVRELLDQFARSMRYQNLEVELKAQEKEQIRISKSIEKYQKEAIKSREAISKSEAAIAQSNSKVDEAELMLEHQADIIENTRKKMEKVN